jgi:hypothetical protein
MPGARIIMKNTLYTSIIYLWCMWVGGDDQQSAAVLGPRRHLDKAAPSFPGHHGSGHEWLMSLPCRRLVLLKCHPYGRPARLTRLSTLRHPYSIVQTSISDPATVVCEYGAVVGWRLNDQQALSTMRSGASNACAPSHCHSPSSSTTLTANLPSNATRTGHTTVGTSLRPRPVSWPDTPELEIEAGAAPQARGRYTP